MATIFYEKHIMPILVMKNEFVSLKHSQIYFDMCHIMFHLNREKELYDFRELVLSYLGHGELRNLLLKLVNEKDRFPANFNQSKPIISMFKMYINVVRSLKNRVEFSWSMPGSIPQHPEVTNFLKSNLQLMIYHGSGCYGNVFRTKPYADHFVNQFSGFKNDFSTEMMAIKIPSVSPYVIIMKTTSYFERVVRPQHEAKVIKEIQFFESFLKN
jgi:hypothetical protein